MFNRCVVLCALLGLVGSYAQLTPCLSSDPSKPYAYVAAACIVKGQAAITWYLRGGSQCGCVMTSSVSSVALPSWLMNSIKGGATTACNLKAGQLYLAPSSSASSIKNYYGTSLTNNQECLQASATGDPHLIGFDGSKFEFNGFPGGVFNLISERDHQVNVLLDDFGVADATYIRNVGMKFGNVMSLLMKTNMPISGDESVAETDVEVNGVQLSASQVNSSSVFDFGGASKATVSITKSVASITVKVHTNAFEFIFQRDAGALHLDMSVNVLNPVSMHGVLGQTMQWTEESKFEGDEADYVVSDLLADDFKFNQFQGAAPAVGTSRALLGLPMPRNSMVKWRSIA